MTTNHTAKEMFWQYACRYFYLDHDGVREEYLALGGGDKEQEAQWRSEYIQHWLSKISVHDLDPLRRLMSADAHEAIPALLNLDDYGDDYSKFWFAFSLADLARCVCKTKEIKMAARQKARSLWLEILDRPRGITPNHRKDVTRNMLEAFNAKTAEEYVTNYTQRKLGELR